MRTTYVIEGVENSVAFGEALDIVEEELGHSVDSHYEGKKGLDTFTTDDPIYVDIFREKGLVIRAIV